MPGAGVIGSKVTMMLLIIATPVLIAVCKQDCVIINILRRHDEYKSECTIDVDAFAGGGISTHNATDRVTGGVFDGYVE